MSYPICHTLYVPICLTCIHVPICLTCIHVIPYMSHICVCGNIGYDMWYPICLTCILRHISHRHICDTIRTYRDTRHTPYYHTHICLYGYMWYPICLTCILRHISLRYMWYHTYVSHVFVTHIHTCSKYIWDLRIVSICRASQHTNISLHLHLRPMYVSRGDVGGRGRYPHCRYPSFTFSVSKPFFGSISTK